MPFQILDLILIGIMLISGLLALMRGFTREVLSLVAWGLAAVAAYFAFQRQELIDLVMPYVNNPTIAKVAVAAAAFVIVLIVVSVISVKISDSVVDSSAGAFDRTLGFIYGLARGLVLVAIAYLFYGWLLPPDKQEDWIRSAQSLPIIQSVSSALLGLMPADIADTLSVNVIANPQGNTGIDQPQTTVPTPGATTDPALQPDGTVAPAPSADPAQNNTTTTVQ